MIIVYFLRNLIILSLYGQIRANSEINNTINSSNLAVFPFKTFYPPTEEDGLNSFEAKDYYYNIHYSNPYIEVELGKNNNFQKLSLFFKIDDYILHLDDNFFNEKKQKLICHYSSSHSDSYEIDKSKKIYVAEKPYSVFASEYFKIYTDFNLLHFNLVEMNFYHSIDKLNNMSYACGNAGLLYATKDLYANIADINLISQIHDNMENVDISWTFQYYSKNDSNRSENEFEGLFIVGIESLEKHMNKNELIPIYAKITECGVIEWQFSIDELYIGNYSYEINEEEIKINTDIAGFEIPKILYNKLNDIYFYKYYLNKICETEIITDFHLVISCHNDKFTDKDINNFPEINLYKFKIGYNFTFIGKELFYKRDNKYFFRMIVNLKESEKNIQVGRLFLKKYQVIFNSDSKTMSFYKKNEVKIEETINTNKTNSKLLIIFFILIGLIFFGIGIYFGKKFCNFQRKRYANELEDDNFIYESKD
jgi:hypothetical protein